MNGSLLGPTALEKTPNDSHGKALSGLSTPTPVRKQGARPKLGKRVDRDGGTVFPERDLQDVQEISLV